MSKNVIKALAEFQAECKPIRKVSDNPFFHSKYAPLDEINKVVKPLLKKHGLMVTQAVHDDRVQTTVWHIESGEGMGSAFPIIVKKENDPQAYGSAVTYARRYSLSALLNLDTEEDDDGNSASDNEKKGKSKGSAVDEMLKNCKENLKLLWDKDGKSVDNGDSPEQYFQEKLAEQKGKSHKIKNLTNLSYKEAELQEFHNWLQDKVREGK